MEDLVNNPNHYRQSSTETIDIIKSAMTAEEFHGYLKGACMKYMSRYKYKGNAVQDLVHGCTLSYTRDRAKSMTSIRSRLIW